MVVLGFSELSTVDGAAWSGMVVVTAGSVDGESEFAEDVVSNVTSGLTVTVTVEAVCNVGGVPVVVPNKRRNK